MVCPICQGEEGRIHSVREMMFATKEYFPYFECEGCGCLSLQHVPENLESYYKGEYYSFSDVEAGFLSRSIYRICLSPLGHLIRWLPFPSLALIPRLCLNQKTGLLDIGCGAGSFVSLLRKFGYRAQGIDPYVESDIWDEYGIRVRKRGLREIHDKFDVILFMHSLEHMPLEALRSARQLIKSSGLCVVRIPIVNWAWQHFGTNWVQLDAPRHLFLHSIRSFELLANQSGFRVEGIVYDSTDFQFWGSEAYERGQSYRSVPHPHILKRLKMRLRALRFNRKALGDQAQFYLRPL